MLYVYGSKKVPIQPLSMAAIPFSFPGLRGVKCLFSTIQAGDMSLGGDPEQRLQAIQDRKAFMDGAGFRQWAGVHQVHGDSIVLAEGCDRVDESEKVEADGQYAFAKGVGLIIRTADCQPILFARRDGGAVGALHVGWRGNAGDFIGVAVGRFCHEFSCEPKELLAVRGPSLGPAVSEFVNFYREWPQEFLPWFNSIHRTVNLWALTRHQLERAGLRPDGIYSVDMCTHTMAGTFFSHRRKDAGRMANAIWMEE